MAYPIPLEVPVRDARVALRERVENASADHAEAMLAMYEVLQGLHDRGVLELLRGALGSGDKVLDIAVEVANSPGSIRVIRNLLLLMNMAQAIDPGLLKRFTKTVPDALERMVKAPEKPGLWQLIKNFFWNQDFRHGLASVNILLEAFGKSCCDDNETGDARANSSLGK